MKKAEARLFGLVRDKHGRPKVDGNPDDLPEPIKAMLSAEDWAYLRSRENADT